ncbi:unnamed protein product [Dicrocoelium dendriticum]|nr:unnamed protein product [Dicrocoelium dendriticum]
MATAKLQALNSLCRLQTVCTLGIVSRIPGLQRLHSWFKLWGVLGKPESSMLLNMIAGQSILINTPHRMYCGEMSHRPLHSEQLVYIVMVVSEQSE